MISEAIADVFEQDETGKATIGHGYTYSGHPVGAAAALACLAETEAADVASNAARRGKELYAGLLIMQTEHSVIGDVRGGPGLMCALELVSDRAEKAAIDKKSIGKVQEEAYRAGAMIRVSGPNIILSPPLVVSANDVGTILDAVASGLRAITV